MKIIQLDVESMEYEPIEPEIQIYEKIERKAVHVKDALLLLISIEKGDTEAYASRALKEAMDFAEKQRIKSIVLYPFAHLSTNLEEPQRALNLFDYMAKEAEKGKLKVYRSPFGWNKRLSYSGKGHPLAEMFRSYGEEAKGAAKKTARKIDTSVVKKSDFVGLPETDHRIIGERLNLFSFQEVSPGMVYWHANGFIIYNELVKSLREKLERDGYIEISTPVLANTALFHVSGHLEHYKNNMFLIDSENAELGMKPMNCPATMLVYKSRKWSYRELPVRFSIFDRLYRNEISGALTGLFRVREISMDDAHLFVTDDQIESEITRMIGLVDELYAMLGFKYEAYVSTMPDSHLGDEKLWEKATSALKNALKANKIKFGIKEKEGAFYGPKIEFDLTDSMGRKWTCATIQVDYQLPRRFELEYTGEDGKQHTPVVLHRAIYGSLERFIGILTEHYQGKFPTWLAPIQARVLSISEQANNYAEEIYEKLKEGKIRVELDVSDKTLDYKIRDGQTQKIPYLIILGKRELEGNKISVRNRAGKQKMGLELNEFISSIKKEIAERSVEQSL
ncbi:MAG TPA: threonine--tRNA ligase [Candidatus Acidoferrum sp.]|nr:threonine--tRNA ligase [Candidatus Acidoferrum sp.]